MSKELEKTRARKAVIDCITNNITVNDCANAILGNGLYLLALLFYIFPGGFILSRGIYPSGILAMCLAGESAYNYVCQHSGCGSGTFHVKLIDALSLFRPEDILQRGNVYAL